MDHVITVRDVVWTSIVGAAVAGALCAVAWFLAALNSDL